MALIAWKKSGGNRRRPMLNKRQDSINICSGYGKAALRLESRAWLEEIADMTWTTPIITEICIGMEVTSYLSAEI
ncbi:MAG TPA: pyrroloquinoline quinone precursor peptide PqqA [Methylocella sp.]|nr:pyrroloquinoline quinone precursor peptide PqqA [Methylocella sp.]